MILNCSDTEVSRLLAYQGNQVLITKTKHNYLRVDYIGFQNKTTTLLYSYNLWRSRILYYSFALNVYLYETQYL